MPNDKVDNELSLALDVNPADREKATNLDVGYTPDTDMWELIIKYNGSLEPIREQLNVSVVELMNGFQY